MKNIKSRMFRLASLVLLSFSLIFPGLASATPGAVSAWTINGTSLPTGRSLSVSATYNDYVYIIGGWTGSAGSTTVYYAPLNANGSVGTWVTNGTSLPVATRASFGLAHNGFMYVMGGLNNGNARLSTIYYAPINVDGSLGSWSTNATPLPQALQQSMTIARDGYLYVYGGYAGSVLTTVRYAPINVDGSIGSWTADTALPAAKTDTTAVLVNDRVYLVGGMDSGLSSTVTAYYAGFNSDHTMGTWAATTSMPDDRSSPGVAASDGYIYVTGGASLTTPENEVFSAKVKSDGTLGAWATAADFITPASKANASVINNNFLYVLGGEDLFSTQLTQVAYASVTPPVSSASVTNPVTSKPAVVTTDFGTDITCSSASAESSLSAQDANYSYPVGLVSFCYDTDAASNVITVIFVTDLTPSQVVVRHFNSTSGTYTSVSGAVVTATTYASQAALQVVYTITDNGVLDTNATSGSVTDPVGLGVLITAPNTGLKRQDNAPIFALIITGALLVAAGLFSRRRQGSNE